VGFSNIIPSSSQIGVDFSNQMSFGAGFSGFSSRSFAPFVVNGSQDTFSQLFYLLIADR
jgi:hypothetical protein